jgi:hypothetical protein
MINLPERDVSGRETVGEKKPNRGRQTFDHSKKTGIGFLRAVCFIVGGLIPGDAGCGMCNLNNSNTSERGQL